MIDIMQAFPVTFVITHREELSISSAYVQKKLEQGTICAWKIVKERNKKLWALIKTFK